MLSTKRSRIITSISPKTLMMLLLLQLIKNYRVVRKLKITVKDLETTELLEEDQGIGVEREDGKDAKRP